MKIHSPFFILVLSIFLFRTCVLFSQQTSSLESGYSNFDQLIGLQNTSLYQGRVYTEKYRTINEKKQFFKSPEFIVGEVWFNGQPYYKQLLKYDVHQAELLLKLQDNGNTLELSKKDIDSFKVEKSHFINLKPKKTEKHPAGFHEILYRDHNFKLYAKHSKNMIQRKDEKYIYYEFRDVKLKYLLFHQGNYYSLNSKKDLLRVFPNHKKQIKQLYKSAQKLNSNDDGDIIIMIIKQLNSIL